MKKYITILFLLMFIAPSIALASWWNPFSWFSNWNFVKKETAPQVRVEIQKIPSDSKNQQPTPITTTPVVKETKKTLPSDNSALIQQQIRIQTEATLRAKTEQDVLIAKQKEAENQARIDALKTQLEKQSKELEQIKEDVNQISKNTDKIVQNTTKEPEPIQPTYQPKPDIQIVIFNNKPLSVEYKIGEQVEIGVALYSDVESGEFNRNAGVTMTTPDESQNKTNGFANTKNGNDGRWFYDFVYIPAESGDHELTFTEAGLSKTITIKVL